MNDLKQMPESWLTWRERFAWHLREVPGLLGEILKHRDPVKAARYDRELVSGSGTEGTPAPTNVDAIDDADELWAALLSFALEVDSWFNTAAEEVDMPSSVVGVDGASFVDRIPEVRAARRGGVVVGVHPEVNAAGAFDQASELVEWLVRRGGEVKKRPHLVASAEKLEPVVRRLRLRYLVERRRAGKPMRRRCTTCGEVAVIVEWAEMVSPTKPMGVGRCADCGQLYVELK